LPYLITCPIKGTNLIPKSVSLTSKPCKFAENHLKIINNLPENGVKKQFGVITKQIVFEHRQHTPRLIEWIEMLRILGASKIHIVVKHVHPSIMKVLDYYESEGFVEVIPFLEHSSVSTNQMHSYQDLLMQMNMLNDCFYRIRNVYDFLVLIDPDEVIVPVQTSDQTWDQMLHRVDLTEKRCSYQSQNFFYPPTRSIFSEVPRHNYMLQHVQRSSKMSNFGSSVKSFYLPEKILVVHNHNALLSWYSSEVRKSWIGAIPVNLSQNSHYRDKVDEQFRETIEDKTLWKYKDALVKAVNEVMEIVGYKE
jgi:hypothetical protein